MKRVEQIVEKYEKGFDDRAGTIKQRYIKYRDLFYRIDTLLGIYVFIPFFIIASLTFVEYAMYRGKKDLTALPIEKQERYKFLADEELRLYRKNRRYSNNWEFEKAAEVEKIRKPIAAEKYDIWVSAPYKSWSYYLYVNLGLFKPY